MEERAGEPGVLMCSTLQVTRFERVYGNFIQDSKNVAIKNEKRIYGLARTRDDG